MEKILREIHNRIQERPDSPAVSSWDHETARAYSWTYGELGRCVAEIVAMIRQGHYTSVGILARKSGEAYAGLLAALISGVPFVPLSAHWPRARQARAAAAIPLSLLLADESSEKPANELCDHVYVIRKSAAVSESWNFQPIDDSLPAYVLFTSGSTGEPKGVTVLRRNLSAALEHLNTSIPISPEDRLSQAFDLTFDLSLGEILWALRHGACLCPFDGFDLPVFTRYLEREQPTVWGSTPSVGKLALVSPLAGKSYSGLRYSLFCGEKLDGDFAAAWRRLFPRSIIANFYGPTETTLYVSRFHWVPGEPSYSKDIPLGEPFPGSKFALVRDGKIDPEAGELWVKGDQVSAGYWHDAARTAQSFVSPPWDPNGVWYRTGDEVVRGRDGQLYFAGRADEQIKILGQRVDLREIETFLSRELLTNWIVVPELDPVTKVAVKTVAACDRLLSSEECVRILKTLRQNLPLAWIPSKIYCLPSLPLTSSSKVDRNAVKHLIEAKEVAPTWPVTSTPLRSWQGKTSPGDVLQFVGPDFATNYFSAVARFATAPFLTAVSGDGKTMTKTFAEFHNDVSRVRAVLHVTFRDDRSICLVSQNSYPFAVFAAAILLERISLCLLNPLESEDRLAEKISALSSQVCLQPELAEKFPRLAKNALPMVVPHEGDQRAVRTAPFGEKAFVLIFTSGTTGYSKVVEQREAGVMVNVDALIERHGLSKPGVIGTPLPLFHVNAFEFSFLCSLFSGSHFVLFESFFPRTMLELTTQFRIEILSLIPDMIRLLCSASWPSLPNLRYLVTAAAPLSPDVAKQTLDRLPVRVLQGYGLSEAVNFSALMPSDLSADEHRKWLTEFARPSIGTPLRGNDLFVLDSGGLPLGEGVTGEIAIRGLNVMKGYLGEDNSLVFRGEYLRTGDRGFFHRGSRGESFFFINGRDKDVIKRVGTTISLVEIDDLLGKYPGREKGIAVGFTRANGDEDLGVAVHADEDKPDLTAFVAWLEREIPEYMRPRAVLEATEPVKTASGKPCRWKFRDRFEKAAPAAGGKKIVILG